MRIEFELRATEEMTFRVDGKDYGFSQLSPLARKENYKTHVHEYVYRLPTGKFIHVTVVGNAVHNHALGVTTGWYQVDELSESDALFYTEALAKFTALNA